MLRHITAGLLALRSLMPGAFPFGILQPLPDGRLFRLRPLCVLLRLLQFLAASAVVDNAVDHPVVILQRHFLRAERIVLFRLLRCHGKGPCAVSHDKVLSIIGNMVDTITGCLHLLSAHGCHLKAAPRCLHTFTGLKTVWQKSEVLFLCWDRENNDIAIDLHKSFRRFELFCVFLDQFRGKGRKIFLTKSNHQESSCYDIINFSIFIPQSTVQIKPYELSFIIADQRHRVRIGISCANVSANLCLQGMKVGVDLLHRGPS